jgi:hypothetical protein
MVFDTPIVSNFARNTGTVQAKKSGDQINELILMDGIYQDRIIKMVLHNNNSTLIFETYNDFDLLFKRECKFTY